MTTPRLTQEERDLLQRIKTKWNEICNGLMHFTGTMRPLLLLEFQGYLDYLKVIEGRISFWELKFLEVDHKVGPCSFDNRITELNATASLEIYLPGKIGEVSIYLTYFSEDEKKRFLQRWEAIICDIEERHNDKE
jgi:hypothetical protein